MLKTLAFLVGFLMVAALPSHAQAQENWSLRCQDNGEDTASKQCEIFQRLMIKDSDTRFAEMAIMANKHDDKEVIFQSVAILPLGFSIPKGVDVVIDGTSQGRALPEFCNENGCALALDLSKNDLLQNLKKGENLSYVMTAPGGETLHATFTLAGITKALKQLQ